MSMCDAGRSWDGGLSMCARWMDKDHGTWTFCQVMPTRTSFFFPFNLMGFASFEAWHGLAVGTELGGYYGALGTSCMYLIVSKVPRYVCILRTEDYRGYFLFRGGLSFSRVRETE